MNTKSKLWFKKHVVGSFSSSYQYFLDRINSVDLLKIVATIFIPWALTMFVFSLIKFDFTDFDNAEPSIATFNGVNAAKRVGVFYLLILLWTALYFIASFIYKKATKGRLLLRFSKLNTLFKTLSILGTLCVLAVFYHFSRFHWDFLSVIFTLLTVGLVFIKWPWTLMQKKMAIIFPVINILLSFLIFNKGFPATFIYSLSLTIIASGLVIRFYQKNHLKWLSIAPIFTILSLEVVYNLIHYGTFQESFPLGFIILFCTTVISFLVLKKKENHDIYWLVFNITLAAVYSISYVDNLELFEKSNPANSVIRVFLSGEIPILDYLSSHLLSEQLAPFLYLFLHGKYASIEFMRFENILLPFSSIITLVFLSKTLKSLKWAAICLVFFPFIGFITIPYYVAALCALLISWYFFKNKPALYIPTSALVSIACLFWRLDIAVSVGLSLIIIILAQTIGLIFNNMKSHLASSVLSLTIIICVFFVGLFIYPEENINQITDYFGASQIHARPTITKNILSPQFIVHYFVFPIITVFVLIQHLKSAWTNGYKKHSFSHYSIIFLSCFVLLNAQRGLIRHSFSESQDRYIDSLFFLLICLVLIDLFKRFKPVKVFLVSSLVLVVFFKFDRKNESHSLAEKLIHSSFVGSDIKSTYQIAENKQSQKAGLDSIIEFLQNLDETETFFDFTNSPMLYAYSNKSIPSFFNQNLQNVVSTRQQEAVIDRYLYDNVRYILFRKVPYPRFGYTDGISNALRYQSLTRFFYNNYQPFKRIGGYEIWEKKNFGFNSNLLPIIVLEEDLHKYGKILGEKYKNSERTISLQSESKKLRISHSNIGDYIEINVLIKEPKSFGSATLTYSSNNETLGTFRFQINGSGKYMVPIWTQSNWTLFNIDQVSLQSELPLEQIEIKKVALANEH